MNVKSIAKTQDNTASEVFIAGQSPAGASTSIEPKEQVAAANESATASVTFSTNDAKGRKKDTGLPEELSELISELKEAVRQINPRKHTKKTLSRTLVNISNILDDINRLTSAKSPA